MPLVDKHPPGSFCWIELATTDQAAAKQFYTSLFEWTFDDMPVGPNDFYTMFRLNGANTAAAYSQRTDEREQGVPPHWNLYIAVENADDAVDRAAKLGGQMLEPPFDIADVGRMAVIQDPTGAVFSIWQALKHPGVGITGVPGTLCWADLSTPDPEKAAKFYAGLFGWRITTGGELDTSGYLHIKNDDTFIGGIPPRRNPQTPAHWLIYFNVSDVDASAAAAKQLGAKFMMRPTTMDSVGRIAILADPQGVVSAIFKSSRRS